MPNVPKLSHNRPKIKVTNQWIVTQFEISLAPAPRWADSVMV